MTISLIKESESFPEYNWNFSQPSDETAISKINAIIFSALKFVKSAFEAEALSIYTTLKSIPRSLKVEVLTLTGNLKDFIPMWNLHTLVLRSTYWALNTALSHVEKTSELFKAKISHPSILSNFLPKTVNPDHFLTFSTELDLSKKDPNVKIEDLLTICNQMDPSDAQRCRPKLEIFIDRVKNKTPFLSTPIASDIQKLEQFYEEIQNYILLSISESNRRMKIFQETHGTDPLKYNKEEQKDYRNIQEDRKKIVEDLANAAERCGTAYIQEACQIYTYFYQKDQVNGGFDETFKSILAQSRLEIAQRHIQQISSDAHVQGTYFQNLGAMLAIPGTKNITEQLPTEFDLEGNLEKFFEEYNETFIIKKLHEMYASKQEFREKIWEWAKSRIGDWNKEKYENKKISIQSELAEVLESSLELSDDHYVKVFFTLYRDSSNQQLYDGKVDWNEYLDEFFSQKYVKDKLGSIVKRNLMKSQLRDATDSSESFLPAAILKQIKHNLEWEIWEIEKDHLREFRTEILNFEKSKNLTRILNDNELSIASDTAFRIINGQLNLGEWLKEGLQNARENEFISAAFSAEDLTLSKELTNWILVDSKILFLEQIDLKKSSFLKSVIGNCEARFRNSLTSDEKKLLRSLENPQVESKDLQNKALRWLLRKVFDDDLPWNLSLSEDLMDNDLSLYFSYLYKLTSDKITVVYNKISESIKFQIGNIILEGFVHKIDYFVGKNVYHLTKILPMPILKVNFIANKILNFYCNPYISFIKLIILLIHKFPEIKEIIQALFPQFIYSQPFRQLKNTVSYLYENYGIKFLFDMNLNSLLLLLFPSYINYTYYYDFSERLLNLISSWVPKENFSRNTQEAALKKILKEAAAVGL